jgi:Outer membrane protein beta-barrel domain
MEEFMKKVVIAFCSLVTVVMAASGSGPYIKVDFSKAGLTIKGDKLTEHEYDEIDMNMQKAIYPAFFAGYEQSFSRVISANAGVGILFSGYDYLTERMETVNGNKTYKYTGGNTATYLSFPLNFKAMLPIKAGGIYLAGSPSIDILLASKSHGKVTVNDETIVDVKDVDTKDAYVNSFNFALGFRIGGEIKTGKHNLFLESGYDFGLIESMEGGSVNGHEYTFKNGRLTFISLGFRINTKRVETN